MRTKAIELLTDFSQTCLSTTDIQTHTITLQMLILAMVYYTWTGSVFTDQFPGYYYSYDDDNYRYHPETASQSLDVLSRQLIQYKNRTEQSNRILQNIIRQLCSEVIGVMML